MQMEITEKMYNQYIKDHYSRTPHQEDPAAAGKLIGVEPIAMHFKAYIKKELERQLNAQLKEMKEKPKRVEEEGEDVNLNINEVRIADIVFAFNND